jgi:putative ATP-dependent endonuclease of OLD family
MKLRQLAIKNFRNLADVVVPIGDTTVLVGENNSGKTSLLEMLQIVLPRSLAAARTIPFDEYDYYMSKAGDSPQTSEGITIEMWFHEDAPNEWPDSLIQDLTDIIQTDPVKDRDSIGLRLASKYDPVAKQILTKWEFLTLDGQPLGGRGANPANLGKFLAYVRLFYLSALRDSDAEFSPRSQFWGRILRDLNIDEKQRLELNEELEKINGALLKADPRLEQVRESLAEVQRILGLEAEQSTSIHALPLRTWDLLAKSELVIRARGSEVDFPLSRHGQGTQSLAVLFLFQAYIDVLLKPTFRPETEAILALEEPEAHLHPQATRALAANLEKIKSQKIISSHSPYFIQEIPFADIRLFRRNGSVSKVLYVKQCFTAKIPNNDKLPAFCEGKSGKFDYHPDTSLLTVNGMLEEKEYRELLGFYPRQAEVHAELKKLRDASKMYISPAELSGLGTYVKRIRGEVLFACAWLLCEGQSEYLLLRYFAELLKKPLDQAGVSVIDFQNNGSPGTFVALARAFEIPFILICDNDNEGNKFLEQVKTRGLSDEEMRELIRPLPGKGVDLEAFLVRNGFAPEYLEVLAARGVRVKKKEGEPDFEDEIASNIRADKTGYAAALIDVLRSGRADERRVPKFLAEAILEVVKRPKSI